MSDRPIPRDTFPFGQPIVWFPNQEWIENSNLQKFMERHGITDYDSLLARSLSDLEWFWEAVMEDLDIQFYTPYSKIVDMSPGIQFPNWCVNGKLNIVHNMLDKWQSSSGKDRLALSWEGEEGRLLRLSFGDLYGEVNRCANGLKSIGIRKGDVVGLYMPMIPELVIAFLAVIKLGAIILPLFSGFGPTAISMRLKDAGARFIFSADGMWRRGKKVAMKPVLDEALQDVTTVEKVIIVDRIHDKNISMNRHRDLWWEDLVKGASSQCQTEKTAAEDTLMIIYTSGTTGKPKGAVHTHCGFPVKAAQDMYQAMDLHPAEVMFWISDMGWMMGPWEVFGSLLVGATMLLFDGAPDYPSVSRIWELVEKHRVTHLGITPTLIRALMPHGTAPVRKHNLDSLRMVGSTGSPWDPDSWRWVFTHVLKEVKPIINYSGGTEISGGILCGNYFKPLKPCAFSGPIPGMDAEVVDDQGNPVRRAVGELVIRQPWIGMTRGFWNDKNRYLDTYWRRKSDTWYHGDYAAIDEDGLWYILGRSDDTIKVGGKRLGPAEVESIVNSHAMISDSAAIGVPDDVKGEAVVVFCVLSQTVAKPEDLRNHLFDLITRELGKPLRPREIKFVSALPKTRNAKIMHRVIRSVYLGRDPGDVSSLEDPVMLDAIRQAF